MKPIRLIAMLFSMAALILSTVSTDAKSSPTNQGTSFEIVKATSFSDVAIVDVKFNASPVIDISCEKTCLSETAHIKSDIEKPFRITIDENLPCISIYRWYRSYTPLLVNLTFHKLANPPNKVC